MISEFEIQLVKKFEANGLLDSLHTLALFGSSARNKDYKQNSDIDLLILSQNYSNISKVAKALREFIEYFGKNGFNFYFVGNFTFREVNRLSEDSVPIHVLFYTPNQFEELEEPEIINGILCQNKVIYGKPIDELIKPRIEGDLRAKTAKLKQLLANTFFNLPFESGKAIRQARQIAEYAIRFAASYSLQNSNEQLKSSLDPNWLNSSNPFEIIQKTLEYIEEMEKHA